MFFRFWAYVFFGLIMEVIVVASGDFSKVAHDIIKHGKIEKEDERFEGKTYLWMIPIYGILILFLFEPLYKLINDWNIIFRYLVWSIGFTFFEGLSGWIYNKLIGFCPWDYSGSKWKVFKNGYTKWSLLPVWGIAGIIIEFYSLFIQSISNCAVAAFKYTLNFWSF
jgi:hypothetical protein